MRIRSERLISYIRENFDDYEIQGIAIELGELITKERSLSPKQLMRLEFSRINKKGVLERDAYRCKRCGDFKDLHVDHIIPIALGGTNDLLNLQTLCRSCNLKKGARLSDSFKG